MFGTGLDFEKFYHSTIFALAIRVCSCVSQPKKRVWHRRLQVKLFTWTQAACWRPKRTELLKMPTFSLVFNLTIL